MTLSFVSFILALVIFLGVFIALLALAMKSKRDSKNIKTTWTDLISSSNLSFEYNGICDEDHPFGSYTHRGLHHTSAIALRRDGAGYLLEIRTRFRTKHTQHFTIYTGNPRRFKLYPPNAYERLTGDQDFDTLFKTHTQHDRFSPSSDARLALIRCANTQGHQVTYVDQSSAHTFLHCSMGLPIEDLLENHTRALHALQNTSQEHAAETEHQAHASTR